MDKDDIQQLLVKYVTKEAGEAEIRKVKHWIGLHPENELYFIELYEAWHAALQADIAVIDEERAYNILDAKINPGKKGRNYKWYKLAAIIVLPVLLYFFVIQFNWNGASKSMQLSAKNGSIKKIALNDGTVIWLNAGSRIIYDADFGKKNRTVFLQGEALFDIGHKKNQFPFLVKARNYVVKDIGTKFNLKAYPNDPFFETAVIRGEVSVSPDGDDSGQNDNRISVKPRQVLKIFYRGNNNPESINEKPAAKPADFNEAQIIQVDSTKLSIYDGWKDDLLVFDGARLGEIIKVLERRYDVNITITSYQLQSIKYSGNFNSIDSVNRVLDIIKQNTPLTYTVQGKNITISKINR